MKTKLGYVFTVCSLLLLFSSIALAAKPSGTFSGNLPFESSRSYGSNTCYTESEAPYSAFYLTNVKTLKKRVTGEYWNGYDYTKGKGKLKKKRNFFVNLRYTVDPWRFKYKAKFSKVTATSAIVKLIGYTYSPDGKKSCKYVYRGAVERTE